MQLSKIPIIFSISSGDKWKSFRKPNKKKACVKWFVIIVVKKKGILGLNATLEI